jgi:hypothetical protein
MRRATPPGFLPAADAHSSLPVFFFATFSSSLFFFFAASSPRRGSAADFAQLPLHCAFTVSPASFRFRRFPLSSRLADCDAGFRRRRMFADYDALLIDFLFDADITLSLIHDISFRLAFHYCRYLFLHYF